MKVCVYAICKNEEQFVRRWIDSMGEADQIVVLDTGSTDQTAELLRERGAQVTREEIIPWRFDTARNRSLELVPQDTDICVCTDLDEVFHPGWRKALEAAWRPGTGQARYRYTWSFNPDGSEGVVFWYERSTPAGATVGSTRSTRCWSGWERGSRGPLSGWRGSSWITTPTPTNPGRSIWSYWSSRCGKPHRMTEISTTWGGNICFAVGGRTASAP